MSSHKPTVSSQNLYWVFSTIAQAIDAGNQAGLYSEPGIDEKEIWAVYLQTLTPFYANDEDMNEKTVKLLIGLCPYSTELSGYDFSLDVSKDSEIIFMDTIKMIKGLLDKEYSDMRVLNDETFLKDCGAAIDDFVNSVYPDKFDSQVRALIFILSVAVRSMIKDTINSGDSERTQRRDSGFFWIAMMLVTKLFFVYPREA